MEQAKLERALANCAEKRIRGPDRVANSRRLGWIRGAKRRVCVKPTTTTATENRHTDLSCDSYDSMVYAETDMTGQGVEG